MAGGSQRSGQSDRTVRRGMRGERGRICRIHYSLAPARAARCASSSELLSNFCVREVVRFLRP
jgi:hypothetical protein